MKRKVLAAAALAAVIALLGSPAAMGQEATSVQIRDIDPSAYPVLTLTISVVGARGASPGTFLVTEDGRPAPAAAVRPLSSGGEGLQVVLVIDTSSSMAGSNLSAAVDAAKQFLDGAPSGVSVGLVTFADTPNVVEPITADVSKVAADLDSLTASGEKALYDGLVAAAGTFKGGGQRNIILLSNGADSVSDATLNSAIGAAKKAHAAVYSIGLKSGGATAPSGAPHPQHGALKRIATETSGAYAAVEQAELTEVYQRVLTSLKHQFLVTYRSSIPAGQTGRITVTAAQGSDTIEFSAPVPVVPSVQPSVIPPPEPSLFSSDWVLLVVLGLVFLAAFVFVLLLMGPSVRARREREIGRRVGVGGTEAPGTEAAQSGLSAWLPTLVAAGDRVATAGGWTASLEQQLEQAGLSLTAGELVVGCFIGAVVGAVGGGLFFQSWLFAIVFAVLGAGAPFVYLNYRKRQRLKALHQQLPDVLMILASSLRAGHSFLQALDTVSKEAADPGAKEFARVVAEIRLGRPMEEALDALAERVGSEDFQWAVLAVNVQRKVGGNLAEVLDTVADTLRERGQIRRQIDTLSVEGKLSMYILIGLPVGLGLYIYRFNKDYMALLFETTMGLVMFIGAIVLVIIGFLWMRRIVKIDV